MLARIRRPLGRTLLQRGSLRVQHHYNTPLEPARLWNSARPLEQRTSSGTAHVLTRQGTEKLDNLARALQEARKQRCGGSKWPSE